MTWNFSKNNDMKHANFFKSMCDVWDPLSKAPPKSLPTQLFLLPCTNHKHLILNEMLRKAEKRYQENEFSIRVPILYVFLDVFARVQLKGKRSVWS